MKLKLEIDDKDVRRLLKKFEQLEQSVKHKELVNILHRQAKPLVKPIQEAAPKHRSSYTYNGKTQKKGLINRYKLQPKSQRKPGRTDGVKSGQGTIYDTYERGNLAMSHGVIKGKKGRSKTTPTVYVGPRVKGSIKYDGWYGWFLIKGTKYIAPNPYIERAARPMLRTVETKISKEAINYIKKRAIKLGFYA